MYKIEMSNKFSQSMKKIIKSRNWCRANLQCNWNVSKRRKVTRKIQKSSVERKIKRFLWLPYIAGFSTNI